MAQASFESWIEENRQLNTCKSNNSQMVLIALKMFDIANTVFNTVKVV